MRVIIAGSRGIGNLHEVAAAIADSGFEIGEIVSGCARGVDQLGERWAAMHGVPVRKFPADWQQFGKRAGFLRNQQMADYADALIAIWDGFSRGTAHMIRCAEERGMPVYVHRVEARERSAKP